MKVVQLIHLELAVGFTIYLIFFNSSVLGCILSVLFISILLTKFIAGVSTPQTTLKKPKQSHTSKEDLKEIFKVKRGVLGNTIVVTPMSKQAY